MLLLDLPDHCLLLIFEHCEVRALATLSTVCSKLREMIRVQIFRKMVNYYATPMNKNEITADLIAVSRLVTSINPTNFIIKIYRNLQTSKDMPIIYVNLKSSSASEVFVESHFLEWLHYLNLICRRIELIHIHSSIYDARNNDAIDMATLTSWPKLSKLIISGHDKRLGHIIDFPTRNAWHLEMIEIRNMFITSGFIKNILQTSNILRNIVFDSCKVSLFQPGDFVSIATSVRDRGGHFPLNLAFVNVRMKGEALLEVKKIVKMFKIYH